MTTFSDMRKKYNEEEEVAAQARERALAERRAAITDWLKREGFLEEDGWIHEPTREGMGIILRTQDREKSAILLLSGDERREVYATDIREQRSAKRVSGWKDVFDILMRFN